MSKNLIIIHLSFCYPFSIIISTSSASQKMFVAFHTNLTNLLLQAIVFPVNINKNYFAFLKVLLKIPQKKGITHFVQWLMDLLPPMIISL